MRRALALACTTAVSVSLLTLATPSPVPASPDPDGAEAALRTDADGPLRIRREGGVATFVGTPAGTNVDNPAVGRRSSVSAAARSHLQRYGATLGAERRGTELVEEARSSDPSGVGIVRYQQKVDDLRVIGGEVVVALEVDRDLDSLNANLSEASAVPAATVTEAAARAVAVGRVGRGSRRPLEVLEGGRWLFDPVAVGLDQTIGARGVWRFEVRDGGALRHMVLVDDRTGAVALDVDLVQGIDRTVCDQANVRTNIYPCTSAAVRTESSAESGNADVEAAFAHAGAVSDLYQQAAGADLTDLIGVSTATGKKLSSTVRVCVTGPDLCPFDNAFWNGEAMFYGEGFSAADDVVGHEMTHGVIERTSGLLYWEQPGAINESLADIIGEIVDHRYVGPDDSPTDWRLGEALPGGAIRDMSDPTLHAQPDRMTSANWDLDPTYEDAGGVHANSGVGNKAFHLISQGGTFNGQTISGIDAGDPTLFKSAVLWVNVMKRLTAFTEYADLAVVLEQACVSMIASPGFTEADCDMVRRATLATEMALAPPGAGDRDADRSCAPDALRRVLLSSETGADPSTKFSGAGWGRTPGTTINATYGVNAYSGDTAWVAADPPRTVTRPLRAVEHVSVPPGQPTFLVFRHWYDLEYGIGPDGAREYYDGGTVELQQDDGTTYTLANQAWQFGPTRTLLAPNSGRRAFSGTSRGWIGSKVTITPFAGRMMRPVFTMRTDESYGAIGWYLDDIEIYTCDPILQNVTAPTISPASPRIAQPLSVVDGTWNAPAASSEYQWLRDGVPISGATASTYSPVVADVGKVLGVTVTGVLGTQRVPVTVTMASKVPTGVLTAPSTVRFTGTPYVGRRLAAARGTWAPSGITFTYRWLRDGRAISGATASTYVLKRTDKGHRIALRITGAKVGYTTLRRTSPSVLIRR